MEIRFRMITRDKTTHTERLEKTDELVKRGIGYHYI